MAATICDERKQLGLRFAHPLKLTALLYLKDALLRERYEDCGDMIDIAREFGADKVDIGRTLSDATFLLKKAALFSS